MYKILRISPRTLQTLRDNGTLAYSQISHKTYYKPEDVQGIAKIYEDEIIWNYTGEKNRDVKYIENEEEHVGL